MKKWMKVLVSLLMLLVVVSANEQGLAANDPMLEAGEVRSLGGKAVVPITLRNVTYMKSGHFTVRVADENAGVIPEKFTPSYLFSGSSFRTIHHIQDGKVTIDFTTNGTDAIRLSDPRTVIGYVTYELADTFKPGRTVELAIGSEVFKGRYDNDLLLTVLGGKIENRMPFGDVIGNNQVTATGAIRVLQHINGQSITEHEAFSSADVNADGILTQQDAQLILDYSTGKVTTFLAVEAKQMINAVLQNEYKERIQARHGRAPYTFKRVSGSLPYGVKLNEQTGELLGTPTRAGVYQFVVQATDAVGETAQRQFSLSVIDSSVIAVEPIHTINVKKDSQPELPSSLAVTYKDKTTGTERVTWSPVDTSILGRTTAVGAVGNTGFQVKAEIQVVAERYLTSVKFGYFPMLNVHTVTLNVLPSIYGVTVNNIPAHYEGAGEYSLASSTFAYGEAVTIRLYDKYGTLVETQTQPNTLGE